MKKLAFLMTMVIVLSCVSIVGFAATEQIIYSYTYDDPTEFNYQKLDDGVTYSKVGPVGNSSWQLNNSGLWAPVYLVNDSQAIDGQYMAVYAHANAMYPQWLSMRQDGKDYLDITSDFSVSFSFNSLKFAPDGGDERSIAIFNVCAYPKATFSSDAHPRNTDYSVLSHANTGKFSVPSGAELSDFTTVKDTWYDLKINFNITASIPNYTVLVKKHSDANYTTLIADCALPSGWDYTQGIRLGGLIHRYNDATYLATDNIKVATVSAYDVTLAECDNGSLSFEGDTAASKSVAPGGEVTVNVTPDVGFKASSVKVNGIEKSVTDGKVTFAVTADTEVSAVFTPEKDYIYYQNYNGWDIAEGSTYTYYTYSDGTDGQNKGSSWNLNFAGSWAHIWLADDNRSIDGKYGIVYPGASEGSPDMYALKNHPTYGTDGNIALTKDFTLGFSVNSLGNLSNVSDSIGTNLNGGIMDINLYSEAKRIADKGNGRSGEGKLITVDFGKTISVVDGSETKVSDKFYTTPGIWYDIKVKVDYSENPTYDLYMKATADDDFVLVADNCAFPEADYTSGIGMLGFATLKAANNSAFAFDNIEVYYDDELDVTLTSSANGSVSFADSALTGSHAVVDANTPVTVNVTPNDGYSLKTITVNGQDMTAAVSEGELTFTVTENTAVSAVFWRTPEDNPSVDKYDIVIDKTDSENPAIIVYSRLNNYTNGFDGEYGLIIWEGTGAKDASAYLTLPAYADLTTIASAKPEQEFAVKIMGDAINLNSTYTVLAYVGEETDEAESVTVE